MNLKAFICGIILHLIIVSQVDAQSQWYLFYSKALTMLEEGNYDQAIENFILSIEVSSEPELDKILTGGRRVDYLPYYHLGLAQLKNGEYEDALASLRKAKRYDAVSYSKHKSKFEEKLAEAIEKAESGDIKDGKDDIEKGNSKSLREILKNLFRKTKTWAVIVGINNYSIAKNGFRRLPYAVRDAEQVEFSLRENMGLPQERIFKLLNEQANKKNIEELLGDELRNRVDKDDRLLVYFSGHGETTSMGSGGELGFFVPFDGKKGKLYSTCISMRQIRDFSDIIPANQILFIVDACYSGIGGIIRKGDEAGEDSLRKMTEAQVRGFFESRGRQVMTAGSSNETARMGDKWDNHSAFTYYFLKGLKGQADYNGDKFVSANELHLYISTNVSKDTDGKQNPQLHYLGMSEGQFVFYREGEFD